ncbi:hypothetical protein GOQ27_16370 [Clostridium sp. D2Q-11]|uniref:Uncharacterized protein n=1 Tax=Anaeromonas frigoriresistens TaxID=2683708 RepID=A0A942ZAB2_9FIRM|nr:hypothetical protein [Anaeromonas frigoriresistens]MBS4540054.1 hypothetical protein [Anaeromonas frigoriresistens]
MINSSIGSVFLTKKKEYIIIFISKKNELLYKVFNEENQNIKSDTLIKKNVIDFSADLDQNDNIHITHLDKEGNFLYSILKEDNIKNNILKKFNLNSNKYKEFKIKATENNIDILYLSNDVLNPNLWTINHLKVNREGWLKNNVITFVAHNKTKTYSIAQDKYLNIHVIYLHKYESKHHVNYISYNSILGKWINRPTKLSEEDEDNYSPEIHVDSKDNLHALWISNETIVHKVLPLVNSYKKNWKFISTDNSRVEGLPIITESKDGIYIAGINNETNSIAIFKNENKNNIHNKDISLNSFQYYNYLHNFNNSSYISGNYILGDITNHINIIYPNILMFSNNISKKELKEIKTTKKEDIIIEEELNNIDVNFNTIDIKKINEELDSKLVPLEEELFNEDINIYVEKLNEIINREIEEKLAISQTLIKLNGINEDTLLKLEKLSAEIYETNKYIENIKNRSFWQKIVDIFK